MNEVAQFEVGSQVTYVPGQRLDGSRRLCRRGLVAGTTVFDACTETTWVPVQVEGWSADREPEWVRADNIIDVVMPR
ncbi:hypothetical protein FNH07_27280 [Amycolatopsis bartoniae]|nr:hypothetical protein FNH07_27280 [Amycolatopsis bartoniae]